MSLYHLVFGQHPAADLVLATLGLTRGHFGRFRDCYLHGGEIAVYTRCGGGNREDYQEVFDEMAEHPCYLRDADDDFDSTYATIWFRYPEAFAEELRKLEAKEPFQPSERWQQAIEALRRQA